MDILLIKKISPDMSKAVETALSRQGMTMALTDQDCVEMIGKNPGGFGVTTLTQILSEKHPLKILSFNGVIPSVQTLENRSYPIYKSLYLVTKSDLSGLASKYIAFVRSLYAKKILEESGNGVVLGKPGE
jgi:phosphate transport system substrate-binding protein